MELTEKEKMAGVQIRYFTVFHNVGCEGAVCTMKVNWARKPLGWNYQDITGMYGRILGDYATDEEARKMLRQAIEICTP